MDLDSSYVPNPQGTAGQFERFWPSQKPIPQSLSFLVKQGKLPTRLKS
jgi:hypothetical protein